MQVSFGESWTRGAKWLPSFILHHDITRTLPNPDVTATILQRVTPRRSMEPA